MPLPVYPVIILETFHFSAQGRAFEENIKRGKCEKVNSQLSATPIS